MQNVKGKHMEPTSSAFHALRPKCQNVFAIACPSLFGWDKGQREDVPMRRKLFNRSDFEPFIKERKERMLSTLAMLKTPEQKKEWQNNIKEYNDLIERDWKAYEAYKAHLHFFMEPIAFDWQSYIPRFASDMRSKVLPLIQDRWESYATQENLDLPFRNIHENIILDLVIEFRKKIKKTEDAPLDLTKPQRFNMFQAPWPELYDKKNPAKTRAEADRIFLKMVRSNFEPHIQARIKSSGLEGEKLEAYKHKIERDLKAYEEFRALLTSFRKEFKKDHPNLNIDSIGEFQKRWEKISGNLDQPWQKLSHSFVSFVFKEDDI
jgi:hypothetical protein